MTSSVCSNGTDTEINLKTNSNEDENSHQPKDESSHINNERTDPIEILKKLEIIKDIKSKSSELETIKSKLIDEVDIIEIETKSIKTYQEELDFLIKEKMEQLEILRQIQEDIENMETTIKQAEEEKKRSVHNALQLHVEYEPLKQQVNELRDSIGLEKLNDNIDVSHLESFLNKFNPFGDKEKFLSKNSPSTSRARFQEETVNTSSRQAPIPLFNPFANFNQNMTARMRHQDYQQQTKMRADSPTRGPSQVSTDEFNKKLSQFIMSQSKQKVQSSPQSQVNNIPAAYRQQPPPMKSCLSCNQQIHRNAPICPLCKAKSRSRNPKKPKKKNEQFSPSLSPPGN